LFSFDNVVCLLSGSGVVYKNVGQAGNCYFSTETATIWRNSDRQWQIFDGEKDECTQFQFCL